jgi:pimeloyl-ACP methyl ester carboxylesterase
MQSMSSLRESLLELINVGVNGLRQNGAHADNRTQQGAADPRRTVSVDGVTLAYDDEGNGPPLVCLHAMAHGARDFEEIRRRFSSEYRVIALDWPGHGRSSADSIAASVSRYAELLEGFLNALGIERPIFLGNSIGGGAALCFATKHPERVRGLILENPAGLSPINESAKRVLLGISRVFESGARGAPWFPLAFGAYYFAVLQRAPAREHRRRIVNAARENAGVLAQGWASFAAKENDLRRPSSELKVPTLFAWAIRDRMNSLDRTSSVIARMPNARIEKMDAGHSPHIETPDELERVMRSFLAELAS